MNSSTSFSWQRLTHFAAVHSQTRGFGSDRSPFHKKFPSRLAGWVVCGKLCLQNHDPGSEKLRRLRLVAVR